MARHGTDTVGVDADERPSLDTWRLREKVRPACSWRARACPEGSASSTHPVKGVDIQVCRRPPGLFSTRVLCNSQRQSKRETHRSLIVILLAEEQHDCNHHRSLQRFSLQHYLLSLVPITAAMLI